MFADGGSGAGCSFGGYTPDCRGFEEIPWSYEVIGVPLRRVSWKVCRES